MIHFHVYGTPKPQPRARAFRRGNRAAVYDPCTAEGWKVLIAEAAKALLPAKPIEGPVFIGLSNTGRVYGQCGSPNVMTFAFTQNSMNYVVKDFDFPNPGGCMTNVMTGGNVTSCQYINNPTGYQYTLRAARPTASTGTGFCSVTGCTCGTLRIDTSDGLPIELLDFEIEESGAEAEEADGQGTESR